MLGPVLLVEDRDQLSPQFPFQEQVGKLKSQDIQEQPAAETKALQRMDLTSQRRSHAHAYLPRALCILVEQLLNDPPTKGEEWRLGKTASLEKAGHRPNHNPSSQGQGRLLLTQAWSQRLQGKEIRKGFLELTVCLLPRARAMRCPDLTLRWGAGALSGFSRAQST